MYSRFRDKFGAAGLIIAVVALVAALSGGAYAAQQGLNGKQKKEVKKIAKSQAKKAKKGAKGAKGDPGAPGATGLTGAAGLAGAAGKDGAPGKNGAPGANGDDGASGDSVLVGTEPTDTANCGGRGGATVQVDSTPPGPKQYACNGEPGEDGETGFTETLPTGMSETGAWGGIVSGEGPAAISFNIPLANALPSANVKVVPEGGTAPAECDNGAAAAPSPANPEADPGYLCIFVTGFDPSGSVTGVLNPSTFGSGAAKTGALIMLKSEGTALGAGTYAVTGAP